MTPNMSSFRRFSLTFVVFLGLCLNTASVFAQFDDSHIRGVDASAVTCGDGTTWNTAYRYLQDALAEASEFGSTIDEIWIAAGTYIADEDCANPGGTGLWNGSFSMIDAVAIYGGFDGTETQLSERDPVANVTILSGELGAGPGCGLGDCYEANGSAGCENAACCEAVCTFNEGLYADCCDVEWDDFCAILATTFCPTNDNAFHVVRAVGVGPTALLDGFTITRGISTDERGGGLQIVDASPTVVRCIFFDNEGANGGGVHVKADSSAPSDPLFLNCSFIENLAFCYGAGMAVEENASVTVVNSVFRENINNFLAYPGAGLATVFSDSSATLINCVLVGNTVNSFHDDSGGGVHVVDGSATLDNCILWDNTPAQISIEFGTLVVSYSDIEDGWSGTGNIDADPLFVDLIVGDYHLTAGSPCIDVGNPDENIIPDDTFDLDGDGSTTEATPDLDLNNRIADGSELFGLIVDMGVYEFPPCCPWDIDDDGGVGAADLIILLVNWGPNPDHRADFNNDGVVGATDLLALLVNWGPCPCGASTIPLTLEEELADACLTMDDWDEFVDVMTDPESSEEDKDRYNCWMIHYLDHCNRCTCPHVPECPSPDPFN